MNKIQLLLKYIAPYKWSALKNILYNLISAVFALFSFTLIIPFLNILFKPAAIVQSPGAFKFTFDYLNHFSKYFFSNLIERNGSSGALLSNWSASTTISAMSAMSAPVPLSITAPPQECG